MKKIFLAVIIIGFSVVTHADWRVEKSKNFSGADEKFLVAKTLGDGTELWIDLQQKFVVIRNNRKTFNKVNGIKLDGNYYDVVDKASGDMFEYVVFCQYSKHSECYKNIFSTKKVEVNVEYFRTGEKVSTFLVNGTTETQQKYFEDDCEKKADELVLEKTRRYRNVPSAIETNLQLWINENCAK